MDTGTAKPLLAMDLRCSRRSWKQATPLMADAIIAWASRSLLGSRLAADPHARILRPQDHPVDEPEFARCAIECTVPAVMPTGTEAANFRLKLGKTWLQKTARNGSSGGSARTHRGVSEDVGELLSRAFHP